jgi:hypothetical protein
MLATVRNNLFHGGRTGDATVDSKARNLELLRRGKAVIDELADIARMEADDTRYYCSGNWFRQVT